eukprot:CAMPEP_0201621998 /NCGR_PEP_ID=MMETSP0492-20130828/47177_1 /ASSEMBLY_ACC=CAM_ASM_000837 /TAXON_ID=420259 /ORGANISM="Thalassiosira gravida, Strain GMp14c1" /LENGTH=234 /DNA_ID=CAMNT_0048091571 /DNA_START=41 /DNA_END=745 /DNA_ORIENTATION=-
MKSTLVLTAAALCLGSSAAFTTIGPSIRPVTSLSMARNDGENNGKTFAASALAAAYLLTGVVSADAAFAMDGPSAPSFTDSSSVMLAGRSGGRAGGRRAAPRAMPRRAAAPTTTKVYNTRTTVIAPPVMGGGYGYGGGYYDPTPGIAMNLGFSAVNAIGNGMRESRQNQMIYDERAELSASREREAEMGARLRQLEMMQMQQGGGGGGQVQPQVIIAQPPAQMAAPAQVAAPAK